MLPDGSGYEICKRVRQSSSVPIIFLTASDEEVSIVKGLDMGANDYITTPFTLTTIMLNELVEKIVVYERDRKGCQDTTQEVEIYFNFVGKYVPPHFNEISLTPEEQEAMRQKDERRDKLHRNYLRRKANGKQKQMRIKSRRLKRLKSRPENRSCAPKT